MTFRLGVDVGGTFTDLVLASPTGQITTGKVLSATDDYAAAIMSGTSELLALAGIDAAEHVRREYGVVIHEATLTLALAATQRLRDEHAAGPAGRR